MPRFRLTVRRMMIAVAIIAVLLLPAHRIYYLYRTPCSVGLVSANVYPHFLRLSRPVPVGRPVPVRCDYEVEVSPWVPAGLPYRVAIEARLIGRAGGIHGRYRRSLWAVAGRPGHRGGLACEFVPPGPGAYRIRYEARVTDLFGRTEKSGSHTDGFTSE